MILLGMITAIATLVSLGFWRTAATVLLPRLTETPKSKATDQPPVSLLVAVRNGASLLPALLNSLLQQHYPHFEIVVCNDDSTDTTGRVVDHYAAQHASVVGVHVRDKQSPGKKHALAQAIATAKHDWLLVTDVDCLPNSSSWITSMMQARTASSEIVLGYSPYQYQASSWLNRWICFEALYTAIQYLTAAAQGHPYMGVGRNMLYHKAVYQRVGGFASHEHLAGGDDDLLVSQGATATNTTICLAPDSYMYSQPNRTWRGYVRQKQRHLSVSHAYKGTDQAWLTALASAQLLSHAGAIVLLFTNAWAVGLLVLAVRTIVIGLALASYNRRMGEAPLVRYTILLDLSLSCYYLFFAAAAIGPKFSARTGSASPQQW